MLSRIAYHQLAVAAYIAPELVTALNSADPNLTVCPECHVDDFVHIEGCTLGKEINEEIEEI